MCCKPCTAVNEKVFMFVMRSLPLCLPEGNMNLTLTVDLFSMYRDGCSHCDGCSYTEGSAERTEWRGDAAGDGQVPLCVSGQGLTRLLLYHTVCHNVLILL